MMQFLLPTLRADFIVLETYAESKNSRVQSNKVEANAVKNTFLFGGYGPQFEDG
jgi:surfactin synthase thioesterase subunit